MTEALQEYNMTIPDDRSAIPLDWDATPAHTIALLQGSAVYNSYRKFLRVWVPILDTLIKPPIKCKKKMNRNKQQRNRNRRQRQMNNNSTSYPTTTQQPTTTQPPTTTLKPT